MPPPEGNGQSSRWARILAWLSDRFDDLVRLARDAAFMHLVIVVLQCLAFMFLLANNLLMRDVWSDLREDITLSRSNAALLDPTQSFRAAALDALARQERYMRALLAVHQPAGTCAEILGLYPELPGEPLHMQPSLPVPTPKAKR